jgi:spermidine synthase
LVHAYGSRTKQAQLGFCGLAYEILWTRALHIFLANSTYSFTSILIVFLFGIALGSILFTRFFEANKQPIALLATCQTIIGLYVIVGAFLLNDLPGLLFSIRSALQVPVLRLILPGLLLSFIIGFIPTLCMGISFPLLCGKNVGKVFFTSTMGSIVGSLIAGFLLIPILGIVKSLISIAFINLGIGLFLCVVFESKKKMRFVIAESCALVIALLLTWSAFGKHMVLPPSMFRSKMRADRILFYIETSQGTVIVNEDKLTGIRACYINNSAVCGTTYDALKVVRLLGHLPFFINPDADTVLIVGFGIGITSSAVAEHDVTNIDCIEICPGVKAAAKFFSRFNKDVVTDPRVKFISEDGRHYVLLTNKKYDIISCDPTHPTLGCNNLYTKEYFVSCKRLLNPGGVICQYLPLHKLSLNEFKTLIRTFSSVFPHTSVWLAHSHGILLGHDRSIQFDFNEFSKHLFGLNDDILDDPYLVAISLILDENSVRNFTADARINTDDHPILEFFTPSSLRRENWHINLIELLNHRSDVTNTFTNIDDRGKMNRYLKGQNLFLSSLVYKNKGDIARSISALKAAAKINPENNEILSILKSESR